MGPSCRVGRLCALCTLVALVSLATIITLWTVALTGGGDDVTAPWERYRLPTALLPISYNITLWPRLQAQPDSGLFIFTGRSTVDFECVKETELILIHSNKLNFTLQDNAHIATLTAAGGGEAPGIQAAWLQRQTQLLVLRLDGALTAGRTYRLHTHFSGELADDLAGFYRSHYEEDGMDKVVAITQMHPTHARKTFPCFDEPAMKAEFLITVIHPPGTVALSNGHEREVVNTTIEGEAVTQTSFEATRKMSSYLLAIVVCDFAYLRTVTPGGTKVRVWARRKALEEGQGDYALNVTSPILDFFQLYYNISYPLSKSDQVALPDFYFGAMENWGLVTYRESKLLFDPRSSSNRNQEDTVTIIAHELAHMWFGNLVTLRWWNEVWLNEGFASLMSYLGAERAEPGWNLKELILLNDIHRVFAVDALASSHPLSSKESEVLLPEQISQQFDAISYSKGAAVLRMLSDFLSEPVFQQGQLDYCCYLRRFSYTNTVAEDLWDSLQMAVEASGVSLPCSVHDIMSRWVLQKGFPVVTVDTSTGAVTQRRFLLDPESGAAAEAPRQSHWLLPVRWSQQRRPQPQLWWLTRTAAVNREMRVAESWLLANLNVTGYYRVNYDLGNWERLLWQLHTDHRVLPVMNRAQLVDDAFNLARAQLLSTSLALRTTSYLSAETQYLPWQSALDNLHYLELMLDQTEVHPHMQAYMNKLVTPLYRYYQNMTANWTQVPDTHTDQYNQANAVRVACGSGLAECRALASSWFRRWMMRPQLNPIQPNLRAAVYCSGVAAGGTDEWEFAWSQFKNASSASEASMLMSALACTHSRELLERYLCYSLDPAEIRKQDASQVLVLVASSRAGAQLAWDFVREKWEYMFSQYGVGSFSFASIISGVTARFCTAAQLQQLEDFVEEHEEMGFGSAAQAVAQALESTRANVGWLRRNQAEVLDWFLSQPTQ